MRWFKIGLSPYRKICFIYFNESHLKMMKMQFSFHHKISLRSQDISIFGVDFLAM